MFGLNGNAIALPESHDRNRGPRPHSWYDPNAEENRILTPYWGSDNNRDSISEPAYVFDLTDTDGDAKILDHMSTHYVTPNTSYRNRTLSLDRDNWMLFDKERMTFIKEEQPKKTCRKPQLHDHLCKCSKPAMNIIIIIRVKMILLLYFFRWLCKFTSKLYNNITIDDKHNETVISLVLKNIHQVKKMGCRRRKRYSVSLSDSDGIIESIWKKQSMLHLKSSTPLAYKKWASQASLHLNHQLLVQI